MKHIVLTVAFVCAFCLLYAQTYPEPEFSNEVYFLQKDSQKTIRLEKNSSKVDTKAKMAGFGGVEYGYSIQGEKSPVRLSPGSNLSFVYSTGASANKTSPQTDSMMRAQGVDPSMISGMNGGIQDPTNMIVLYKTSVSKGDRKIYLMKSGGAFSMGKNKSSDKYTLSMKKIREGYWVLLVDKTLPKGEYAFTVMTQGSAAMDVLLFAFGID